jgi:hypothetical protein
MMTWRFRSRLALALSVRFSVPEFVAQVRWWL